MTGRKLVLFISMSLDGYIATKDNELGFLSMVEQEGEDYGYNDFVKSVDEVIIGRKTKDSHNFITNVLTDRGNTNLGQTRLTIMDK
jgi:dihydrofolate reductase